MKAKGLEVVEGSGWSVSSNPAQAQKRLGCIDMDALPIQETSKHSYCQGIPVLCMPWSRWSHDDVTRSTEELAHSLDFDGTVIFIFQPNEENGLGAKAMLDEDLFRFLCLIYLS